MNTIIVEVLDLMNTCDRHNLPAADIYSAALAHTKDLFRLHGEEIKETYTKNVLNTWELAISLFESQKDTHSVNIRPL